MKQFVALVCLLVAGANASFLNLPALAPLGESTFDLKADSFF